MHKSGPVSREEPDGRHYVRYARAADRDILRSFTVMNEHSLFDTHAVRAHRMRALRDNPTGGFLFEEIAQRVADRLLDVQRQMPVVADISGRGDAADWFERAGAKAARGIETTISFALDHGFATGPLTTVADQEVLPFADGSLNLVTSILSLHTANDLPGVLVQVRRALRPDGFFLAAMFGGETLTELRACLTQAEIDTTGGVSPRIAPFADVRDLGSLLQRTGFALPVADQDRITVTYATMNALMRDLRAMGETNPLRARSRHTSRRAIFARAAEIYRDRFATDGRLRATFDVVYLTGWAPHDSQQKPLRPGQASTRLADALETEERSAGEQAGPRRQR